jgi:protoheme IX farnesyltransferase
MLRHYWQVIKPGIIGGNLITFLGGFFLASHGRPDIALMLVTASGLSLIIASACVLNNCADRDIDRLMLRTRTRALACGLMSPQAAIVYASMLGLAGLALLQTTGRLLSLAMALAGFAVYAGAYSLYLKRRTVHATLIGSLAGAAPPLVGYCAAGGHFDMGAVILLLIFALWQVPHFYAIAIYRLDDYRNAAIPVLPIVRGTATTKLHIVGYIMAFTIAALALGLCGYAGAVYLLMASAAGLAWLFVACKDFKRQGEHFWARRMFLCSLTAVVILSAAMSLDPVVLLRLHQVTAWNP